MEVTFNPNDHFTNERLLIDVRSPGEFQLGHIPGALSIPLFNDEERAEVGTIYKRQSKEEAVLRGLEIVGPKMAPLVQQISSKANGGPIVIYCWRGGMRSGSVELLLQTLGFKTEKIKGGYKGYRQWAHEVIQQFASRANLQVVSGMTGSGKTQILHELQQKGNQIIDLEGLANHRGSAFGHLMQEPQPSTEHFINLLAAAISKLDDTQPIWIEDESRLIGKVVLPDSVYNAIQSAPHHIIRLPIERRTQWLVSEYGKASTTEIELAFNAIKKRLGGLRYKEAMEAVQTGDAQLAAQKALSYYDSTYTHALDLAKSEGCRLKEYTFNQESFESIASELSPI